MRASREEALDLLRKWAAERTPLECRLTASGCVSHFRGMVNSVLEEGFRVVEPGGDATLEVRFRPSFEFMFDDATGRVRGISDTLIVFLREDEGKLNDFISLSQIVARERVPPKV